MLFSIKSVLSDCCFAIRITELSQEFDFFNLFCELISEWFVRKTYFMCSMAVVRRDLLSALYDTDFQITYMQGVQSKRFLSYFKICISQYKQIAAE